MPVASLQHQLTTAADDPLDNGRLLRHYGRLQRALSGRGQPRRDAAEVPSATTMQRDGFRYRGPGEAHWVLFGTWPIARSPAPS
jgi:hypothetical protein